MMSKKILVAALAAVALCPTPAEAGLRSTYQYRYDAVAKRHGKRAPGRNIVEHGMRNGKPATAHQIAVSSATLKRMLTVVRVVQTAPAPVALTASRERAIPPSTPAPSGSCGVGYRGLYQFDCQTWRSVGGSGDPAAASPAEQRARAEILRSQRGNQPWPVCGQGGASLDAIARCESGGNPHAVG